MKEIYSTPFKRKGSPTEPGTAAYWLAEQRELLRKGELVDPRDRQWTVAEWALHWHSSRTTERKTDELYRGMITNDLDKGPLGTIPITDVEKHHIADWMQAMQTDRSWSTHGTLAVSTINVRRAMISAIFNGAIEQKIIYTNPAKGVKKLREQPGVIPIDPKDIPTRDQIWTWYDVASQVAPHLAEAIIIAAGTGLRPGELLGIDESQLTRDRSGKVTEIYVSRQLKLGEPGTRFGRPKTDNSYRRIPVGKQVSTAIDRHLERYPLDTTTEHGTVLLRGRTQRPWSRTAFDDSWCAIRDGAGTPDAVWYRFRHYYISGLIEGGASPKLVMERAGHGSPGYTLARYARLWPNADQVTAQLSDAALERDMNGTPGTDG
jgi:integrase